MVRLILFFVFLSLPFVHQAQYKYDCNQLAIDVRGISYENGESHIILEASNQVHTGTLYYYPSFSLINEDGEVIAKDITKYYGIGSGFQIHQLELLTDSFLPFEGTISLHGNNGSQHFCDFPIYIEDLEEVKLDEVRNEDLKVLLNYSEEHLIIDIKNHNDNNPKYHISILDSNEKEVESIETDLTTTSINISDLREGIYEVDIWDNNKEEGLPIQTFEVYGFD